MHEAIQVAQRVGMKLVIAGIIQDQDYFDSSSRAPISTVTR